MYVVYAIKERLPETVLSTVILRPEVPARYTFTVALSEPGGVVGIRLLSAHTLSLGTTKGDAIASPEGDFLVPLILPSSAIPVFDAV